MSGLVQKEKTQESLVDDLFDEIIASEEFGKTISRLVSDISLLRNENRWQDIVELCYPLEEKWPEVFKTDAGFAVVDEVIFALGQLKKFDEALELAFKTAKNRPDDYRATMQIAYTAYMSLQAAANREIMLTPAMRKERLDIAHRYFKKCEEIRPDGVTCFYRHGVLYRSTQNKPAKARPLFEKAISNWESLSEDARKNRHRERKHYVKALYQLSLCLLELGENKKAEKAITRCIEEDREHNYVENIHKYYTLGKILCRSGKFGDAVKALQRAAVDADPTSNSYVFYLMARCYLDNTQPSPQKALEALFRIPQKRLRPHELRLQAEAYIALGKLDKAKEILQKAADRDKKGRHKSLKELAVLEARSGNLDKALDYLKKADDFFRHTYGNPYATALYLSAAVYLKLGDLPRAESMASELKSYFPDYPGLKKILRGIKHRRETMKKE